MLRFSKYPIGLLAAVFLLTAGAVGAKEATTITLLATVSDGYQLIDDAGQPYEVENTVKGNDLVLNHVGHKVEVTGTVLEEVDYKIVVVESYRVVEE